jgi:hypothetical protein
VENGAGVYIYHLSKARAAVKHGSTAAADEEEVGFLLVNPNPYTYR